MRLPSVILVWSVFLTVLFIGQHESFRRLEDEAQFFVGRVMESSNDVVVLEGAGGEDGGIPVFGVCGVMHGTDNEFFAWDVNKRSEGDQGQVKTSTNVTTRVKIVKGLLGVGTVSLKLCDTRTPTYIIHWGCKIIASPVLNNPDFTSGASFILHSNQYHEGYFALEATDFGGHFVAERKGLLWADAEDSNPDFRAKATWRLRVPGRDEVELLDHRIPVNLNRPATVNASRCSTDHSGCCEARVAPSTYPPLTRGPSPPHDLEITPIVISSTRTLFDRMPLLSLWLFPHTLSGTFSSAIISLDTYTPIINTSIPRTKWVVGPMRPVSGISLITIRVTTVMHWAFERRDTSWYFMVDDDTLVFAENLRWAVGHFVKPREKVWYVGHSSEWEIKKWFHGIMAYGGGGVLVSRKAAVGWMEAYQGGYEEGARAVHESGMCSATGGDGAFCRCLNSAVGEDEEIFTDFNGFHQFDIVGTSQILDLVKGTCPNCPPIYEQVGLWTDDVIAAHVPLTFHHTYAIPLGGLYPGLDGAATGLHLMEAYNAHPPYLFLRRVCLRTVPGDFTVCVNFGHRVQVFKGDLPPSEAMVILELNKLTANRPFENLKSIAIRDTYTQNLVCSLSYRSPDVGEYQYVYSSVQGKRPSHDVPCEGQALLRLDIAAHTYSVAMDLSGRTYAANGSYAQFVIR